MSEKASPKLQCTKNYDIFEMHEFNRPLHEDPRLLASMRRVGFMPSSPIHCVRNGSGKLKVVRGHHRLDYAKRLGLSVWYVVDDTTCDIFELEGGRQQWTVQDFLQGRAASGNRDYQQLIDFQRSHGLRLSEAASLLGGESAGSHNKIRDVKKGSFKVVGDLSHARAVVSLIDWCHQHGVSFARSSGFVSAVSMSIYVSEFDPDVFRHRVKLNGQMLRKRTTRDEYLEEIEALYNYAARGKRLALAFEAKARARERQAVKRSQ